MKRMFAFTLAAIAAFTLSSCMTTLGSLSGNGPIAQARRADYIKAHPGNPFNPQIQRGELAEGMTLDDLQALYGSQCGYSADSSAGTFYECHLDMLNDYDTTTVLVDNSGHVASWIQ
ncbi:MAG: hypothetical protein ACTHMK_13675 [Dyella sp.]|uniref:hypothetical protein n=1 Tax=Dyella sp. TaxID=1869338 RepID=UPI003F7F3EAA